MPEPKADQVKDPIDLSRVTIEFKRQPEGSVVATSPEIPELLTEGATFGDAVRNAGAAIGLVEDWYKSGKRVPSAGE